MTAIIAPPGHGKRILAILDDPDLRDLFRAALEPEGYRVGFETSQLAAAACARQGCADYLVVDMGLLGRGTSEPGSA